jgi:hypothetical protein
MFSGFLRQIFKSSEARPTQQQAERDSPRYDITLYARLLPGGTFVERCGNIGIGGFCFEGEQDFAPGTRVELLFRLPGTQDWIHAQGLVLGTTQARGFWGVRGKFDDEQFDFEKQRLLARWIDEMRLQLWSCAI